MRVFIHTGFLSVDNGAFAPMSFYFALAKATSTTRLTGNYYGQDSLEIQNEDWCTVEQLLIENKMLYKVEGLHDKWQNAQTAIVRDRLNYINDPVAAVNRV